VRGDEHHHYGLVTVKAKEGIEVTSFSVIGDGTPKTILDSFAIVSSGDEIDQSRGE
jgi:hypothetical protein